MNGEVVLIGCLVEDGLCVRSGERLQELLVWRRDSIVELVSRCPERVAARFGEFRQSQDCVITWNGFKGDVAVPLTLAGLVLRICGGQRVVLVDLLRLLRTNDTDFIVFSSMLPAGVADRVNMKFGGLGLSTQLSEALRKNFLKVIVEVILLAEEHHASLRNCNDQTRSKWERAILVIARSRMSSSELGALSHSFKLASGNSFPITGVTSNDLNWSRAPLSCNGSFGGTYSSATTFVGAVMVAVSVAMVV